VWLLAAALALDAADKGAVGALAPMLQHDFSLDNSELGLLATVVSVVSALCTLPAGALVDRLHRTRLLAVSMSLWAVAMLAGAVSWSYGSLLASRVFLGAVLATAPPVMASLTGELFRSRRRGRALAGIEAGELVGLGIGVLVAGGVLLVASWRAVFALFAVAGVVLAALAWRVPEPARGSASACRARRRHDDASWRAIVDVVRIPTNAIGIVAGAIGYFFFAGLRVFAVVFVTAQYGVSPSTAALLVPAVGAGALVGLWLGGRFGDAAVEAGHPGTRLALGVAGYVGAAVALVPPLLLHDLVAAVPFFVLAGLALALPNPAVDAVRLDVVPGHLWGRSEGVRTTVRTVAEAVAPVSLGVVADHVGGGGPGGVRLALAIALPALALNGVLLAFAIPTYRADASAAGQELPVPSGS